MRTRPLSPFLFLALLVVAPTLACAAQNAPPAPAAGGYVAPVSYPKRVTDPAAVDRGKSVYIANGCTFCHGGDARGGNGGPSLLRSQTVLRDQKGELISEKVTKGVPGTAMVAFPLKTNEIADLAEYLHSFDVAGYDNTRLKPAVFTMGNAGAGKKYFASACASCHAVDGDLKGIAGRFDKPRDLQQGWLNPRSKLQTKVRVAQADGTTLDGTLIRIDEFLVSLQLADGSSRTIARDGDQPTVTLDDPLAAHRALLRQYRDRDIHDLTAYLVTLK